MKKSLVIFLFLFPLSVFAQALQPGFYACNGSVYTMSVSVFGKGGLATVYYNDKYLCNATVTVNEVNIAFTFGSGPQQYRGKTWVYKLINDSSFDGNGEHWVKVGSTRLPSAKQPAPSVGSITNPDQGLRFSESGPPATSHTEGYLKSGVYSLWGSRYSIYLVINGMIGYGSFQDEYGSNLGDFRASVSGDILSISFVNSQRVGVSYDYKITSDISFSRYGETWLKSGEIFVDKLGPPTTQWHFR